MFVVVTHFVGVEAFAFLSAIHRFKESPGIVIRICAACWGRESWKLNTAEPEWTVFCPCLEGNCCESQLFVFVWQILRSPLLQGRGFTVGAATVACAQDSHGGASCGIDV